LPFLVLPCGHLEPIGGTAYCTCRVSARRTLAGKRGPPAVRRVGGLCLSSVRRLQECGASRAASIFATLAHPVRCLRKAIGFSTPRSLRPSSICLTLRGKRSLRWRAPLRSPRHTSQRCRCGHVHQRNRPTQFLFRCRACGYEVKADLNGARSVAWKYLASIGKPERAVCQPADHYLYSQLQPERQPGCWLILAVAANCGCIAGDGRWLFIQTARTECPGCRLGASRQPISGTPDVLVNARGCKAC
jgi:hypothetical protein